MAILLLSTGCVTSLEEQIENLTAKDPEDRMEAAVALGDMRSARAVNALEDRMARDDFHLVRAACARALNRIGRPSSIAAFVRALEDKSATVRWEAVVGLGRLGAREEAQKLAQMLKGGREVAEIRRECAKVLGLLGTVKYIPDLIDALEDGDASVRLQAELALRRLTGRDLGTHPSDWRSWYGGFNERMGKGSG
jgi:HEAT repeat protein